MKNEVTLESLNEKALSIEGSIEIASGFTENLATSEELQNPWVVWNRNAEELGQEIYTNRNRKLSGLVIGVKDIIATQDFPTRMGAESAWKNPSMGFNARIVAISKELGAVIGGKTKSSEFAVHQQTDVINPKYPGRTAGTSSSGSAAAVASGSVGIALATQTAGSIARPSSYCGVIGFKPTFGDFPRTGVLKTTDDFDTVGVIGQNPSLVRDFYLSTRLTGSDYPLLASRRQRKTFKKIAILVGDGFDSAEIEIIDLVEQYYRSNIQHLGFSLIPKEEFFGFNQIRPTLELIYRRDLGYYFKKELNEESVSSELNDFVDFKNLPTSSLYNEAKARLSIWQKDFQFKFEDTLLLSLAASSSAPVEDKAYEYDLNAAITAAGFPQLCIPAFNDSNNRNISLSLSSSKGSDEDILALGIKLFRN